MPGTERHKKNSLSIRLTEPAVFLRTRPGNRHAQDSQPSMLRGLLVLDLAKPTRISSIELELQAGASTAWPEGFGARRIEITEEHNVFHASAVYFRAKQSQVRRTTSIGPGIALGDADPAFDDWDDYLPLHTPPVTNGSSQPPTRPPSIHHRRESVDSFLLHRDPLEYHDFERTPPSYSPLPLTPALISLPPSRSGSTDHLPAIISNGELISSPTTISHRGSRNASIHSPLSSEPSDDHFRSRNYLSTNGDAESNANSSRRSEGSSTPHHHKDNSRERRDRNHTRFSLSLMSNALMDVVRSKHAHHADESRHHQLRGRTLEKGKTVVRDQISHERTAGSKERSPFSILGDMLRLDHEEHKESGSDWKEFKKGTYTYPISISIPGHAPPTLHCQFGSVVWRLKAVVHRPGAFKPRWSTVREVIVVASPVEDDTEDTENIVVERHWEQQLQYLLTVSGRSFYIGGTIPISFTLLPLSKIRVHKIVVCLEERVDYYTQMRRIARTDPITQIVLLSIKGEGKGDDPILPLESDDVDAFRKSPLYALVRPDDDPSEMASSLMGPGPWEFYQELKLPSSCNQLHFTNRNRRSNVSITHTLKWTIRVERGDDLHINPKTGRRKMFDIVVQSPVHILSCRCNPDWTALPGYGEKYSDPYSVTPDCPCQLKRRATGGSDLHSIFHRPDTLERITTSHSSDSGVSTVESSPISHGLMSSLRNGNSSVLQLSTQYEQLVSGQVTETGEMPPAYVA
ncbi:hypothetical protein AX17_004588 [Amanita inopinata Kibby_2008]|nr:hypothetical protein AX17_004588 [Amanita inopinata Kibby_2008]